MKTTKLVQQNPADHYQADQCQLLVLVYNVFFDCNESSVAYRITLNPFLRQIMLKEITELATDRV